jgi:hypothetical protein
MGDANMATTFFPTSAVEIFDNPFVDVIVIYPPEYEIPGDNDTLTTRTYAQNKVDYTGSGAVNIDLERLTQIGGFATALFCEPMLAFRIFEGSDL